VVITWLKVPEFFDNNQFDYGHNTFQIVLYKDGRINLIYSEDMTATQALVGIVPGYGRSRFRFVDFSTETFKNRPVASLIENFDDYESVDIAGVTGAIYKMYPDKYDFITLVSNFDLAPVPDALAFAINIQNDVDGIGNPAGQGRSIFNNASQ